MMKESNLMSEKPCTICGGDHQTGFCTTPEGKELAERALIERAHEHIRQLLLDRNIVTRDESELLSVDRLDELLVRSGHALKDLPEQIPEVAIQKTRRMLGLGESGKNEGSTEQRQQEIEKLVDEMRVYLEKFQVHQDNIVGMILCGSRLDKRKVPAPNSDVDVVLVFESGFTLDPSTPEGESLLFHLRGFSDSVRTESGFEVELDEFYGVDTLQKKLANADSEMLVWGWNADATRYIGNAISGRDEALVNERIHELLTGDAFTTPRRNMIHSAAQKLISS